MNKTNQTGGKDAIESTTGNGSEVSTPAKGPFFSLQRLFQEGATQVHNFKGDPLEVYREIAKSSGAGCKSADDLTNKSMQLKWFYCHEVEMANGQTGEFSSCIRTVLVDQDGTRYQFVSAGIATGLDVIRQNFGDGPWVPAIKITVQATKVARGKVLNIVPVE